MEEVESPEPPWDGHRAGLPEQVTLRRRSARNRTRGATVWLPLFLTLLLAACTKGPPAALYPSTNFVLYTADRASVARSLEAQARTYLNQVEGYLRLCPPPGAMLRIHHFRWRVNLWRYLNASYPALRWRKSACFEAPESYVIALSGNPRSEAVQSTLRHELTHYLLAVHYAGVPPWLDEGLAEILAAGPPFPHLPPNLLDSVRREMKRYGSKGCLRVLTLPSGSLLSPGDYQVACGLVSFLLQRDREAIDRLHAYLNATGPATPPERSFTSCWSLSMEETCMAMQIWTNS